jgi:hypothetical protein
MHYSTILLHFATALQVRAAAAASASWTVAEVILSLVDVDNRNTSIRRRAELWVEILNLGHYYGTKCLLRTSFPVSPDEWSFCTGGEFYFRARNLVNSTDIRFDLDVLRMSSSGSAVPCVNHKRRNWLTVASWMTRHEQQKSMTIEMGTAKVAGNSTGSPNNLLDCKFRRQNKDIRCALELPRSRVEAPTKTIAFQSERTPYNLEKLQVRNFTTTDISTPGDVPFKFEVHLINPNHSYIVPGSLSLAAQRRIPHLPAENICTGSWDPDGPGELHNGIVASIRNVKCTNKSYVSAVYHFDGTRPPYLELLISDRLHSGVGGLALWWKMELNMADSEEFTDGYERCNDEVCRWEDSEVLLSSVHFQAWGCPRSGPNGEVLIPSENIC